MESSSATLSFERAVRLFQEWGILVERCLRQKEVTLILQGPGHRSCYVYEKERLLQIAAVALRVRRATGASGQRSAQLSRAAAH